VNFPTKLAKLVQFTLEKHFFPIFSQFLLSKQNLVVFKFFGKKVAKLVPFMFTDGCETEGGMDNSHPPHGLCNV